MGSEYLNVANIVLHQEQRSLSARQIVDIALGRGLISDKLAGKTPWQTMKARLSEEIRANGSASQFVRTAPGKFNLRDSVAATAIYQAKPFQPPTANERVLVVPRATTDAFLNFQGITRKWRKILENILHPKRCSYVDRHEAEQRDDIRQILTYVLVTSGDSLLAYRRGHYNRVEDFLRGSRCIGFGGHVNERDRTLLNQSGDQGIIDNATRELNEELRLPSNDIRSIAQQPPRIIGVLNDDSSPVGRRHLAFVLKYEVCRLRDWIPPRRGELSIRELMWLNPKNERIPIFEFEYWSQLVLREYHKKVVAAQPTYLVRRRTPFKGRHVLCVTGPIGSGKTEATRVLVQNHGYSEVNSGRVVASLLGIPPVPETPRAEFQAAAAEFIGSIDGPTDLGRALAGEVQKTNGRVLVDGVRHPATLEALRKALTPHPVPVVFVHTLPDIAYSFYIQRSAGKTSFGDFMRIREAHVESQVVDILREADAVLYNWTGRADYERTIGSLMNDVGIGDT